LLRSDLSLNFYLARERAAAYLHKALGEFRDYNGGVIFKQTEILDRLKQEFIKIGDAHPDIIDDFFYSISPIEKQATLSFSSLKSLFGIFYNALQEELSDRCQYILKIQEEGSCLFVVVRFLDKSLREHLVAALNVSINQHLIVSDLSMKGTGVLSYIFENQNPADRNDFCNLIRQTIVRWLQQIESTKVLRMNIPFEPTSLDPRLAGDVFTGGLLRLLFEGLIRLNKQVNLNMEWLNQSRYRRIRKTIFLNFAKLSGVMELHFSP
jgi:hypothetical protein